MVDIDIGFESANVNPDTPYIPEGWRNLFPSDCKGTLERDRFYNFCVNGDCGKCGYSSKRKKPFDDDCSMNTIHKGYEII